MHFKLVFLSVFVAIHCEIIRVKDGMLRGTKGKTKNEHVHYKFRGIPYAEPPVGDLRLRPPIPNKPWSGIRNVTQFASVCVQPMTSRNINSNVIGHEDCLYLNVFTPTLPQNDTMTRLPVIFYVYGGGFIIGSGNVDADYFMDKNIVLVTTNYRLGPLGFFGMNNDIISGNFGLKDQVLAMKWVKENIAAFGGDPENVTLLGQSVGSASAHLHLFSPLSKGLFNKVIMQSGTAYTPWAYYDEPHTEVIATAFLAVTGCSNQNTSLVLKCLQNIPAEELSRAGNKLQVWEMDPIVLFKATQETNVRNQPFLPHEPSTKSYQIKNIPWIIGMDSGEGIAKTFGYLSANGTGLKYIDHNRKRLIPLILQYLYTTEFELLDNITQKIINYYFGNDSIGLDSVQKFIKMVTDAHFTYPLIRTVLSSNAPRYVYLYNYTASFTPDPNLGVGHGAEIPMLFRNKNIESKWSPKDEKISQILINFWVNFSTYGDPNGVTSELTWKPVESNSIEYLHISNEGITMAKNLMKDRYNFWNTLPLGRNKYQG